jgi:hypothetical protein
MSDSDLGETAAELTRTVQSLQEQIRQATAVSNKLNALTKMGLTARRLSRIAVGGFVLDVILTVALGFFGIQQAHTTAQLNGVIQQQHDAAICPLYKLFIDADTQASRDAAAKRGDDLAGRKQAFDTIRQSYSHLHCTVDSQR